jgi:hypothetical protein
MTIYKRQTIYSLHETVTHELKGQKIVNFRIGPEDNPKVPIFVHNEKVSVNLAGILGNTSQIYFSLTDDSGLVRDITAQELLKSGITKLKLNPQEGSVIFKISVEGGQIEVGRWADDESAMKGIRNKECC